MKTLKKLPKFTRIPKIVKAIDPTEEELEAMIARYPYVVAMAIKEIFENGTPITEAAEAQKTTKQLVRYYLNKMHLLKHGEKYNG